MSAAAGRGLQLLQAVLHRSTGQILSVRLTRWRPYQVGTVRLAGRASHCALIEQAWRAKVRGTTLHVDGTEGLDVGCSRAMTAVVSAAACNPPLIERSATCADGTCTVRGTLLSGPAVHSLHTSCSVELAARDSACDTAVLPLHLSATDGRRAVLGWSSWPNCWSETNGQIAAARLSQRRDSSCWLPVQACDASRRPLEPYSVDQRGTLSRQHSYRTAETQLRLHDPLKAVGAASRSQQAIPHARGTCGRTQQHHRMLSRHVLIGS